MHSVSRYIIITILLTSDICAPFSENKLSLTYVQMFLKWTGTEWPTSTRKRMRVNQFLFFFKFFVFLGPHLQHKEVPRLGAESELQLSVYTTAMATRDLSHICKLHHSSWQRWILNPLSEARDQTRILMNTSRIHSHCTTTGTLYKTILKKEIKINSYVLAIALWVINSMYIRKTHSAPASDPLVFSLILLQKQVNYLIFITSESNPVPISCHLPAPPFPCPQP